MSYLKDFLASIKEVKFFSEEGELPSGCLLFDTREAAWEAARDAAEEAEWDAKGQAAWYAAGEAAWKVAGEAVGEAAWKIAGEAARDAALVAACMSAWNNPSEPNTIYALKRWSVWQAGFGLLCDIEGTLYCYRRVV